MTSLDRYTLEDAVYLRLTTPQGTYWADNRLGHTLGQLTEQTSHSTIIDAIELALADLLEDNIVTAIDVAIEGTAPLRVHITLTKTTPLS